MCSQTVCKANEHPHTTQPYKQMRWSKVQREFRRPNSKRDLNLSKKKQQRQGHCTLNSTYESRKNLDSFGLSITSIYILNKICKTASKFEKEVIKIGRRSSRSRLEYAKCRRFMLLFFWKNKAIIQSYHTGCRYRCGLLIETSKNRILSQLVSRKSLGSSRHRASRSN